MNPRVVMYSTEICPYCVRAERLDDWRNAQQRRGQVVRGRDGDPGVVLAGFALALTNAITGDGDDVDPKDPEGSSDPIYHWGGLLGYIALDARGVLPVAE